MTIRPAGPEDRDAIWTMLEPVFRAGDTYTIAPDVSRDDALAYWMAGRMVGKNQSFLAEDSGQAIGTYYLKPNQGGGGDHVCNCGFVTAPKATGRGVARSMIEHALLRAKASGFLAMQFNFVVNTNTRAIQIWEGYGFEVVGRLPQAFRHPQAGLVDALIMYKAL